MKMLVFKIVLKTVKLYWMATYEFETNDRSELIFMISVYKMVR